MVLLHEFIAAHREELIARCREKASGRSDSPPVSEAIEQGVPLLLDQLVSVLRAGQTSPEVARTALLHGRDLLHAGFPVGEVVHTYGDVCQSVTEMAVELNATISAEDFRLLNKSLDDAIASAVTEFGRKQVQRSADGKAARGSEHPELRNLSNAALLAFEAIKSGQVGIAGSTAARSLLASIVDWSDDAIISKNLNGIITSWNAGAERVFGYAAAEAIGQSITLIIPPERRNEEAEILRRLRQGQSIEHFETQRLTKDGRHVSISLSVSPVRNRQGVVIGASKIARDITDRVRADEERARLLASEQAARAQAEEANRGKDQFLATVSHELRTPLNAILGWAAMLDQTASLDARTSKGLQSIQRNTRTLAQLVDDLLDVSRMIAGKMRLDVIPIDLGGVIEAAVEAVLPAASSKDIGIHVVVDPAARTIVGDPTRLQQAVWNLISNAVKFTPTGGRVDVSTRVDKDEIELAVSDSGIGIDATFLPYVFDRFRQADSSSTRAQGGLGLGLAIVRHLVELHGGTVRAESDGRDAGTRFVIQLPRTHAPLMARDTRKPVSAAAATAVTDVPRLDGVRILIVDDDRESREMILEALRGYGASLRCAISAGEAIDALSEFKPDLVLSDIAMPGRDGYAVLSEVRALEATLRRHVPIAAVTAYAHAEDRERAIAAGFDEYLAKPVDPAALASAVAALAAVSHP